jgi:hypothetical protein
MLGCKLADTLIDSAKKIGARIDSAPVNKRRY